MKRIGQRSGCQTWRRGRLRLSFVTLRREEIDWAGLRAAAVAIGIRPAARQAAQDLPPDEQERFVQRAMKRCSREKWLVKSQQDKANAIAKSPTALSADVRKGSDVLNEALAEDSRATRLGLSAAAPQSTDLRPREKEIGRHRLCSTNRSERLPISSSRILESQPCRLPSLLLGASGVS